MTYELALELKNAGFPQREPGTLAPHDRYCGYGLGFCFDDDTYCPTLSELIEACGAVVFELLRQSEWHQQQNGFVWTATIGKLDNIKSLTLDEIEKAMLKTGGLTPEIAVANLWLALNKK